LIIKEAIDGNVGHARGLDPVADLQPVGILGRDEGGAADEPEAGEGLHFEEEAVIPGVIQIELNGDFGGHGGYSRGVGTKNPRHTGRGERRQSARAIRERMTATSGLPLSVRA
jgi:hypothetical protein